MSIKQFERRIRHALKACLSPTNRRHKKTEKDTLQLFREPKSIKIYNRLLKIRKAGGTPLQHVEGLASLREVCRLRLCSQVCQQHETAEALSVLADEHQYFPESLFQLAPGDVFLDAGGYTGDTALSILKHTQGKFKEIHTFEPDPQNYAQLCANIAVLPPAQRDRIRCYPLALGLEAREASFASVGSASGSIYQDDGFNAIKVVNIHEVVPQETLDSITFIKMDIEGAEMELLKSLETEIRRHRPILAVCLYHGQEDLFTIPAYIHSLVPHYNLVIRHHSTCRCETVLYAIPPQRALPQREIQGAPRGIQS